MSLGASATKTSFLRMCREAQGKHMLRLLEDNSLPKAGAILAPAHWTLMAPVL